LPVSHLIKRLERIETEYAQKDITYKKCRGEKRKIAFQELIKLEKIWRAVKRELHRRLKPLILERDGYRCRVCEATEDLELARLFEDSLALLNSPKEEQALFKYSGPYRTVWERYSPDNMFILCKKCHRRFDSFIGRAWRMGENAVTTVEEAVKVLGDEKVFRHPPILEKNAEKYRRHLQSRRILTFLKVLRKSITYRRHGDIRKFRFFIGLTRRELNHCSKELPCSIMSEMYNFLKNAEYMNVVELERVEKGVRAAIFTHLKGILPIDEFNEFLKRLAEQDMLIEKNVQTDSG